MPIGLRRGFHRPPDMGARPTAVAVEAAPEFTLAIVLHGKHTYC